MQRCVSVSVKEALKLDAQLLPMLLWLMQASFNYVLRKDYSFTLQTYVLPGYELSQLLKENETTDSM